MTDKEREIRKRAQHKQYLKRVALGIQRKSTISGAMCKSQAWRLTPEYKNWKLAVLEKHGRHCDCGSITNLQVHHIKPASKFPELRFDVNNGEVKCFHCHTKINKESYV